MPVSINGATGIQLPLGSASAPAETNTTAQTTGIYYPSSTTLGLTTNGTNALYIDASQNVGIGTTSPGYKLEVSGGDVRTNTTNFLYANTLRLRGSDTFQIYESAATTNLQIGTNGAAAFIFTNNGVAERMRIDSSGNLGLGTTAMTRNFNIGGTAAAIGLCLQNNGTSGRTFSIFSTNSSASVTGALAFYDDSAASYRMLIDANGQLIVRRTAAVNAASIVCSAAQNTRQMSFVNNTNNNEVGYIFCVNDGTTTQYATSSDYRLKENIKPMTGGLEKVAQLNPVTFDWKINGAKGQGFIAHELQAVIPDAVSGEKDGVENYIDEEGKEQTRPNYQAVDASFVVATLVKAIQELKAEIDTLKSKVDA